MSINDFINKIEVDPNAGGGTSGTLSTAFYPQHNPSGFLTGITPGTGIIVNSSATAAYTVNTKIPKFNLQVGTGYTLTLADASNYISMGNTGVNFIVIPAIAQVTFNSGMEFTVEQAGAGTTAITGVPGVTINSRSAAFRSAGQYGVFSLVNKSGDFWLACGDLIV